MKFQFSKKLVLLLFSVLFASTNILFAQKKAKDKTLDGVKFTIKVTEDNGKKPKPMDDELVFKDLKLKSDLFDDKYSFKKGPFTYTIDSTDVDNKIINFTCEMENDMKDKLMWGGKIDEETIEGKVIWMKKDKVKKSFDFTGNAKKK
ncbi:MAG: hypothetical protein WCO37_04835 [Bacteroidota bacterium]|jgi:hypothetical protein